MFRDYKSFALLDPFQESRQVCLSLVSPDLDHKRLAKTCLKTTSLDWSKMEFKRTDNLFDRALPTRLTTTRSG